MKVSYECGSFRDRWPKKFKKLVIFSKYSKHFALDLAQEKSHQYCLASFSESETL